jgi:hypothetical protein
MILMHYGSSDRFIKAKIAALAEDVKPFQMVDGNQMGIYKERRKTQEYLDFVLKAIFSE